MTELRFFGRHVPQETQPKNPLIKQTNNLSTNRHIQDIMKSMVQLSSDLKEELKRGNIFTFGKIMHENWILKKS